MASVVSGPFLAACVVLALAGIRKLRHPASAQPALTALRLPSSRAAARAIGAGELNVAAVGFVLGSWFALAVAAAYVVLAVVALRLLLRSPGTPCGCLGTTNAPVTRGHVGINVVAALVSLAAATGASPWSHLPDEPAGAIAFVVLVACLAHITSLMLDAQPALRVAMQRGRSR